MRVAPRPPRSQLFFFQPVTGSALAGLRSALRRREIPEEGTLRRVEFGIVGAKS